MPGRPLSAILAAAATLALAAPAPAQELTVYSSLPLQGPSRPQTLSIVNGARLALEQAGGRAGSLSIRYVSLDDSTAQVGSWVPERVARNARRAGQNPSAIAYIGEFNSGASAISMPILNEAGLFQVSPSNTYTGLTRGGPGVYHGDPETYYPTGTRHYARLLPNDAVQAEALAQLLRESRCRRTLFTHDGELYGEGIARGARRAARARGVRSAGLVGIDPRARNYRVVARRARRARARCVLFGGITANNAVQLFRDLHRGVPRVRLFGSDGIAESGFADPRERGVPGRVARRVRVTASTLAPSSYPPEGQRVLADYSARFGDPNPDPYALTGYEAMALVLDAIRAGGADRAAVIRAAFATRDRRSPLGTYSIDANGDTTLRDYGVYRISRGEFVFDRVVRP